MSNIDWEREQKWTLSWLHWPGERTKMTSVLATLTCDKSTTMASVLTKLTRKQFKDDWYPNYTNQARA